MIDSIRLSYIDKNDKVVVTTLNHDFVQECVDNPPRPPYRMRRHQIDKTTYMKFSIRKKIRLHVKQYLIDVEGVEEKVHINSL